MTEAQTSPAAGTRFCGKCGAAIPALPGPCPSCGAVEWAAPAAATEVAKSLASQAVDQTRLGLLLLAVGVVASLLPVGAILGDVLALIGGFLLIRGSGPFGPAHRRNATLGLALGFGGALAGALAGVFLSLSAPPMPAGSGQVPGWIQSVETGVTTTLLVTITCAIVSGFGFLLITYSLQDRTGRMCLWLALALGAVINVALLVFIRQGLDTLFAEASAGQGLDYGLLTAIFAELGWFTYLGLIPNALYAGCYFLADTRIRRGIIPAAARTSSGE